QVNLTVETLQRGFERCNQENQHVRAVIVQHSLGHPAEIAEIKHWCDKRKLILIEDLAQGFGATASDGDKPKPLGSFADTIILSFGRDKVIDAVSGGAVIFREPSSPLPTLSSPPTPAVLKDLAYPFWTWLIRATYSIGLGKIIHKMLTIMGLMTNPTASPTTQATALPASLAKLALSQLQNFNQAHQHRQKIAALYLKNLSETPLQLITQTTDLDRASLLRLAATTDNPQSLLNFLKHHQIHLTDRWYRSPVDCGKLNCATNYQSGSCPRAKQLANTIINLPTHQKISIADAQKIIDLIKKYFEKQKK
ncbi:MAG: DegT/DnrJ/EryC1/StrS family aminotransferase, partial [Candidatus Paceibacterota bacterium]